MTSKPLPPLRRDLRFTLQQGKELSYIVEDGLREKFYRVNLVEYLVSSNLDGRADVAEVTERTNRQLGKNTLTVEDVLTIVDWLRDKQLLRGETSGEQHSRLAAVESARQRQALGRLNLMSIKVPLGNPHRFFSLISPWLSWITGKFFFPVWLCVVGMSVICLEDKWMAFMHRAEDVLAPDNLFFLWLSWFLLKVVHEVSHALVCYRYKGRVTEAGLLFILFFPLTYVNASSSWSFPSRWRRIHTAAAGMYAEIFIAALALLVWHDSPNSIEGGIAHNLVIVAGFSSLLFNANPLMRFDGYFILSDLLNIPNLYGRGREFVRGAFYLLFFGINPYVRKLSGPRELFIGIYGVSAWLWRLLVLATLLFLAAPMFHGFGILIAVLAAVVLIGSPILAGIRLLRKLKRERVDVFHRFWGRCMLLAGVVFLLFYFIPVQESVSIPAVVRYRNEIPVKSEIRGFVADIPAEAGERVKKGEPVMHLDNSELLAERARAELELRKLSLKMRLNVSRAEVGAGQVIREQRKVAGDKLAELQRKCRLLSVTAPESGLLLARKPDQKLGTFLQQGETVFWIVSENEKKLIASVAQDDITGLLAEVGEEVEITLVGGGLPPFLGRIDLLHPKADQKVPDGALTAAFGGPVPVRYIPGSDSTSSSHEFYSPRFTVEIELPSDKAAGIPSGRLASVSVGKPPVSLFTWSKEWLISFFRERTALRN